jgi:hypothetical protein
MDIKFGIQVAAAAANISDATTKAKALSVAKIPSFTWFDTIAKVPDLGTYLADASAQGKASGTPMIVEIIVYDLPDRYIEPQVPERTFESDSLLQRLRRCGFQRRIQHC